eukprot:jgi/Botrbrau1/6449/Bobra.0034s0024.1
MQAWVPAPALFPASQQKLYSQYAVRLCNARNAIAKQSDFRISRCCVAQLSTRQELLGTFRAEPAGQEADSQLSTEATAITPEESEEVFLVNTGPTAELVISLLLAPTLIYLPLTIASVSRRLWISQKFTNKRIIVINTSPLFSKEIQVAYSQVKEVRTAPRAFGLWGDMVVFLKDGSRLEIPGVEKYQELKAYIEKRIS